MGRKAAEPAGDERLFDAIGAGDVKAVVALLAGNPSLALVRATADRLFETLPHWLYAGDTPLHLAAAALEVDMVTALLKAGSDAAAVNRRRATALHYACDPRPQLGVWDPDRQARIIDALVKAGAPVNAHDSGGAMPLHRAVRARSAAAVHCLLSHGADVSAALAKSGSTPLHLAITGSGASGTAGTRDAQEQITVALVDRGADPMATDGRGRTVLSLVRSGELRRILEARQPGRAPS